MNYEPSFLRDCLILGGAMLTIAICAYRMGWARGRRQPKPVPAPRPQWTIASHMNAHLDRPAFTTGRN